MQTCSLRPNLSPQPLGFVSEFETAGLTWDSSASEEPAPPPPRRFWQGDLTVTVQVNPLSLPVMFFRSLPGFPGTFSHTAFPSMSPAADFSALLSALCLYCSLKAGLWPLRAALSDPGIQALARRRV